MTGYGQVSIAEWEARHGSFEQIHVQNSHHDLKYQEPLPEGCVEVPSKAPGAKVGETQFVDTATQARFPTRQGLLRHLENIANLARVADEES